MEYSAVSTIWIMVGTVLIFFMQAGFAMLETGMTRVKNAGNIAMKNLVDYCIGSVTFWLIGFGIMYGGDGAVLGKIKGVAMESVYGGGMLPDGIPFWAFLIFQTVFAATAATIVSGAMAARTEICSILYLQSDDKSGDLSYIRTLDMGRRLAGTARIP